MILCFCGLQRDNTQKDNLSVCQESTLMSTYNHVAVSPDMCTGVVPSAKVAKIALFILSGGICGLPYEYLISHNYHLTCIPPSLAHSLLKQFTTEL